MDRKANQKDEKQIYQLMCQLEQTQLPYDRFAEIFRQQLAKEQYYCLVWEEEGRVVGVLNLRWEGQLHHAGKVAEILELIVSPDCRNQGVGRKMFARACQLAQDFGCGEIEVTSNRIRTGAHRFYLREGMEQTHLKFTKSFESDSTPELIEEN